MTTPTPTPNQLPTVLGVGSSAIEAAARAVAEFDGSFWDSLSDDDKDLYQIMVTATLTAAAPFIAAQAKAEALRDAAEAMPEWPLIGLGGECDGNDHHRAWLRAHADHIEGKSE